ncbi:MAG: hypothetical protein CML24_11440 [Rhizobiales bacterium]|nr:hypothetical protein [Hyphomicrobiales bacterium]
MSAIVRFSRHGAIPCSWLAGAQEVIPQRLLLVFLTGLGGHRCEVGIVQVFDQADFERLKALSRMTNERINVGPFDWAWAIHARRLAAANTHPCFPNVG